MSADSTLDDDYGDVLSALRAVSPVSPSPLLAARAEDRASVPPTGAAAVQAAYADDGYALLCALLSDEALAQEALEKAMFRVQQHLDRLNDEPTLSWPEFLRLVVEVGAESRRLLHKAGAALSEGTLDMLDGEDQLYVLLCGGLGLSDEGLRIVFPKEDPATRRREVAARLAEALPTPAHEGGGELRATLAAEVLGLEAPGLIEHRQACALCRVQAERLREEVDVPLLVLPDPEAVAEAIASRSAKDREHRAAVLSVQARVSVNCTYCHASMTRNETAFCSTCLAAHHEDCFREYGRCAAPGCGETVAVQPGLSPAVAAAKPAGWRRWIGPAAGLLGAGVIAAMTSAALVSYKDEAATLQERQAELLEEQQRLMDQAARQDRQVRQRAQADLESMRRAKQLEIQDLRERLDLADDQVLELGRKHDQEKERLRGEKERLLQALERQEEKVRALAAKLEAEREKLREELWATFQDELERRGLSDVVAEMKKEFADVELENEVEATFRRIEALAKDRKVEELIKEFETLRALMAQAKGGSESVQRKILKWQKKLSSFGQVQLDVELQVYVNEGNQHLRAMTEAVRDKEHLVLRERFAKLMKVLADMNGEEREVFGSNARALFLRGRSLIAKGGAVIGKIKEIDLTRGRITIGETSYAAKPELLEGAGGYRASFKALMFLEPGDEAILFFEGGMHNQPIVAIYADRLPEPAVSVVTGEVRSLRLSGPTGHQVVEAGIRSWIEIEGEAGTVERYYLPARLLDDAAQRAVLEGFRGRVARAQLTLRGKRIAKIADVTVHTGDLEGQEVRFDRLEMISSQGREYRILFVDGGVSYRLKKGALSDRLWVFLKRGDRIRITVEAGWVTKVTR